MILFEMCTGDCPYSNCHVEDAVECIKNGEVPDVERIQATSLRLSTLLRQNMDYDPKNRMSLKEMSEELFEIANAA